MASLTAIDLFCGCGGLTSGLKKAGFTVIGAVDNDPLSIETYNTNHSDVKKVWRRDIKRLSVSEVMRTLGLKKGDLDLLAGCPPCQGFSSVRTLNGSRTVNDPRNDLVLQFLRFLKRLEPRAIMMENVPGLARDGRLQGFYAQLERLGYTPNTDVLDVAEYGVPQRRKRFVLLAGKTGKLDFAPADSKRVTVRDTIGSLPPAGTSGDPLHDIMEKRTRRIIDLIARVPKDGGSRKALGPEAQLPCHKKCDGFKDIYGRMAWDDVAPTITGGCVNPSKGRFLHPEYDRAITLREAALLQSFDQGYFVSTKRGKYYAAVLIGNALPPEFVRVHAAAIAQQLIAGTPPAS